MKPLLVFFTISFGTQGVRAPADPWFGADKVKHFFTAAFVQSVSYGVLRGARAGRTEALTGASAITAVVSLGKEVQDGRARGAFSARDLVWDAAGAGAATVLLARAQ